MIGFIDSGTTNSRVFLVEDGHVVSQGIRKVGVRDTVITGNNRKLRKGLHDAVVDAVKKAGVSIKDIQFFVASGMITSEIGLLEVPHLVAPASKADLAASVIRVQDREIFPFDIPIVFVRGIKNSIYGQNNRLDELANIDFMRGEEVQVVGILEHYHPNPPLNVIVCGSHFKIIHVDNLGRIAGGLTTISGQFYEALIKETSIGKCVQDDENEVAGGWLDDEIIEAAIEAVHNSGLLRAMLMPRFMQVLLKTNAKERRLFINAAIATEDMRVLSGAAACGFNLQTDYYIMGTEQMCHLYDQLVKKRLGGKFQRVLCYEKNKIIDITIRGAIEIVRESGVVNGLL